ncbi:hypothetical protein DITRI_Ditri05aG0142000 [Diplodiscus trichospermus]
MASSHFRNILFMSDLLLDVCFNMRQACANLLQEYAQKMNYANPIYQCQKDESPGRMLYFSCTADIGGIWYMGAVAGEKKKRKKAMGTASNTDETVNLPKQRKPIQEENIESRTLW